MNKYKYDIEKFDFRTLLKDLYGINNLENLHLQMSGNYSIPDGLDGLGKDTDSRHHKIFFDKIREGWEEFVSLYVEFIKVNILPKIDLKTNIYQTLPSYRIQFPNSKAITTLHCDSDDNHKHPHGEINILLPITKMVDSSAIWAESKPNLSDFSPMNCEYGEYYIWNGNQCRHFNKSNKTEKTRISLDFRILPDKYYISDNGKRSATSNKKFIIGDYYSKFGENIV